MATPKCTQTRPEKVVLPKLKTLTPEAEQQLTPYQKGVYHGMIEMLEMVESSLKLAGVEYQAASIQEVPHA
ncbi:hypothetical protein M942_05980 [Enterobacter ludwigii]|jgi:hypothetical protein|uniref:hypothetical protein n=1 Tax=Enterobacter ludwigii TaxID=299767 RepID=UPI0003D7B5B8|nr:hypothetical protein [Enterobacter ludwigii]AHE72689.1 hypothetical protein M942_05980 [Enterobacter ludwigii]